MPLPGIPRNSESREGGQNEAKNSKGGGLKRLLGGMRRLDRANPDRKKDPTELKMLGKKKQIEGGTKRKLRGLTNSIQNQAQEKDTAHTSISEKQIKRRPVGKLFKETLEMSARQIENFIGILLPNEGKKERYVQKLENIVKKTDNICLDKNATCAFQQLMRIQDPGGFQNGIRHISGEFNRATHNAYNAYRGRPAGNTLPDMPRNTGPQAYVERVSQGSGKPGEPRRNVDGYPLSEPYEVSKRGITLCSATARKNLSNLLGTTAVPGGDADSTFKKYLSGEKGQDMLEFTQGSWSPPGNANVADIMLDTPQKKNYARDYGHRAIAYKRDGQWWVIDPYIGGAGTHPQPLQPYLALFNKPGYSVRGVAYYKSDTVDKQR